MNINNGNNKAAFKLLYIINFSLLSSIDGNVLLTNIAYNATNADDNTPNITP